jgi:hypothetical protein
MQAFFSIFFQRPSHPVWNAARLGMMSLRTRPPLQLLATLLDRDRPRLNTTGRRNRPLDLGLWSKSLRSYSQTEDRVASTRLRHILGRRPIGTPDSPLLFLAAR